MQELITVIIPVYKVENYIDKCVESVLAQSYENLEIILVDDGSPDSCGEICDSYALKDSRIHVIHKENGGLSSARNAALDVMKGQWVMCVDSDDYVHTDIVKDLYDAAKRYDADISVCSHYQERGDKLSITERIYDNEAVYGSMEALKKLVEDEEIKNYAWGKLYRAELFDGVRYPDGRNYEDIATTYYLFDKAKKIVKIPDYLYYYLIRDDSISFNSSKQMWHKGCHATCLGQQERCEYFKKKEYKELYTLAQAKLLPYLFSDITSGYSDEAYDDVKMSQQYIRDNKNELLANPLISNKDKRLIDIYLKDKKQYQFYSGSKAKIRKVAKTIAKTRKWIKTHNEKGGFELNGTATKRIVYFELPCFDNLGDHAIAYAAEELLSDFCRKNPEYQLYSIDGWKVDGATCALKRVIGPSDVIVCQGGGNFGSLYEFAEVFRRKLFKRFPNNRIIMMPQTCYYAEDEAGVKALREDKKLIDACRKITLFARDEKSLEFMKNNFDAEVKLLHDTVSLYDASEYSSDDRKGIIVCLRSDKESKLSALEKKMIISECENREEVLVTDTCTGFDIKETERETILKDKWKLWGNSRLVVTDRLHGAIFALITKTPCIVIGNNHFKVYEAYKTFEDVGYLKFIDSSDQLSKALDNMLSMKTESCIRKTYSDDIQTISDRIRENI